MEPTFRDLTTPTTRRAAGGGGFLFGEGAAAGETEFLGEAVGVLGAELEAKSAIDDVGAGHGKLRDELSFVLDFHRHREVVKEAVGMTENGGELSGREAVVDVVRDPGLEQAMLQCPQDAAAVDERLLYMADLGDVEVRGDQTAIGQGEGNEEVGMRVEVAEEGGEGHGLVGLRGGQQGLDASWSTQWRKSVRQLHASW